MHDRMPTKASLHDVALRENHYPVVSDAAHIALAQHLATVCWPAWLLAGTSQAIVEFMHIRV